MYTQSPLANRFEQAFPITEIERKALDAVPIHLVTIESRTDVLREGDRPRSSLFLVEGMVVTSKEAMDGKRQIMAVHIPGDWPDLFSLHLDELDCDFRSLTECKLAFVEHTHLKALCADHPRIAAELWRTTMVDASVYREWVVNVGRRPALSRVAHVFSEMLIRMEHIGRSDGRSCSLPFTQEELGEATGLSIVHINRVLKTLKAMGLATHSSGVLTVVNRERLADLADFRSNYLHMSGGRELATHR